MMMNLKRMMEATSNFLSLCSAVIFEDNIFFGKLASVPCNHHNFLLPFVQLTFVLLPLYSLFDNSRLCDLSWEIFDVGVHHVEKLIFKSFWFSIQNLYIFLCRRLLFVKLRFLQTNVFGLFAGIWLGFFEILAIKIDIKCISQINIFFRDLCQFIDTLSSCSLRKESKISGLIFMRFGSNSSKTSINLNS